MSYINIEDLMKIGEIYNSANDRSKYYRDVNPNADNYSFYNGVQDGIRRAMECLGYKLEPRVVYEFKIDNKEEEKEKEEDGAGTDDESDTETEAFEG